MLDTKFGGGAFRNIRDKAHISFKNNNAPQSGGIYFDGESMGFIGNGSILFEDNTGMNGGALHIKSDTLIHARSAIPSITFIQNKALKMGEQFIRQHLKVFAAVDQGFLFCFTSQITLH